MKFESDMDRELRFHIEQATADYIAQGMTPAEARARAFREFGSIELTKDELRDTRVMRWLYDVGQDLRYAFRGLRQSPGFALTAVIVLALGIGANTAVFTLFHRTLLASLPVEKPEELVELNCANPLEPEDIGCGSSYPGFLMFAARTDLFRGIFTYAPLPPVNAAYEGASDVATGIQVTGGYYQVLGVKPALGRLLDPSDDSPNAPPVVVLSYPYWNGRFGGDSDIIGKTISINGRAMTVIGVTQPEFRGANLDITADVTLPLVTTTDILRGPGTLEARGNWWLRIIARRGALNLEQLEAALRPVYQRTLDDIAPLLPLEIREAIYRFQFVLRPASGGFSSELRYNLDRPLRILMAAVGIVLLIACANIAGLLMARASVRRREFAVRRALGAGRPRILRQVLTETLLIALMGAGVGILFATQAGEQLLAMAAGENGLRAIETHANGVTLTFTAGVSILVAIFVGFLPAWRLSGVDPQNALKEIRADRAGLRFSRLLIPAQVALTTLLLIGAVLFLRTFENFRSVDAGYSTHQVLTFRAFPDLAGYDNSQIERYFDRLRDRLEQLPGVASVTFSRDAMGDISNRTAIQAPGFTAKSFNDTLISRSFVAPRFVETTGLHLLSGRDFTSRDTASREDIAVVNETFAQRFYGTTDVVGRQFTFMGDKEATQIIGVVADARDRGAKVPIDSTVYWFNRSQFRNSVVSVRANSDASALISAVQAAVKEVDAAVPVRQMQTTAALLGEQLGRERMMAALSGVFGLLALLLTGVGLYGLISGAVAARTRELGIRVALGAEPASVAWLVTRESVVLVAAGAAVGLAAGYFLARFVESQLFEVRGTDPAAFATAVAGLILCACLAAYLPARRAASVDPVAALRAE